MAYLNNADPNTEIIPPDIYQVSKEHLQEILSKFGIKYYEKDRVSELRPVVASLKSFFKTNVTEEKKSLFRELIVGKRGLSDLQLNKYPALAKIEEFLRERENLYDQPELNNFTEPDYEDVVPALSFPPPYNIDNGESSSSQRGEKGGEQIEVRRTEEIRRQESNGEVNLQDNSLKEPNMSKEKLPLISASTYHGLPTESPQEFVDKYEIAAISNHWTEQTKLNLFPAYLAGTALSWYQHYSKGKQLNSWEDLKKVFTTTFTPAAQAQTLQALLDRKVQGREQPVLSYFLEVITLCRRHDPSMRDSQIIQYVIQGLRPEFCERVLNETCDTLDQLEQSLKKIELQIQIRALNKEKFDRADRLGSQNDSYTDTHRERLNNIEASLNALTQVVSSLKLQQPEQPDREYAGGSTNDTMGNYQHNRERVGNFRRDTRDYRQNNNRTNWGQQSPHKTYQSRNYYAQGSQTSQTRTHDRSRGTDLRSNLYCTYCKRTNHDTQDCRLKGTRTVNTNHPQSRYCDYCKMTNHSRENCFRLKRSATVTKNA
jgi:hypothetical protein